MQLHPRNTKMRIHHRKKNAIFFNDFVVSKIIFINDILSFSTFLRFWFMDESTKFGYCDVEPGIQCWNLFG